MSVRNILVAFNGSADAEAALRYGASIARANGGHVTALLAHSGHEPIHSGAPWVPARARDIIAAANAEILTDIRAKFDALSGDLDLGERLHYLDATGRVDAVISETARCFDVLIVGRPYEAGTDEHVVLHPDRIALLSGRPVIVVPAGYDREAHHDRAAVAWDGSRAAARALFDALQLLAADGEVAVLTVDGTPLPRPLSELTALLDRHGITAHVQYVSQQKTAAATLLAHVESTDPSLLVMGAYEHSKFREDFLGGVTADVLRSIRIPVLISH